MLVLKVKNLVKLILQQNTAISCAVEGNFSSAIRRKVFMAQYLNSSYFDFALDHPTDYLFQYNYIGRSETTGIYSQQFIPAEGGFKSQFDNPYSDDDNTLNSSIGL